MIRFSDTDRLAYVQERCQEWANLFRGRPITSTTKTEMEYTAKALERELESTLGTELEVGFWVDGVGNVQLEVREITWERRPPDEVAVVEMMSAELDVLLKNHERIMEHFR